MRLPRIGLAAGLLFALAHPVSGAEAPKPHNVIIFVADGLRYVSVTP